MKIWVITAISCHSCSSVAIATFDHKPTDLDVLNVNKKCGGMYCIRTDITETELNGDPEEIDVDL